jgi:hypothetical protein
VNLWSQVFLGVIAVATLATAIVQVGVLIAAGRLARRVERLVERVESELTPAFGHINAVARDASRAAALAALQIERADRLFGDLALKIEETVSAVQSTILAPAREGMALVHALRAALDAIRQARRSGRSRADDEDALFI